MGLYKQATIDFSHARPAASDAPRCDECERPPYDGDELMIDGIMRTSKCLIHYNDHKVITLHNIEDGKCINCGSRSCSVLHTLGTINLCRKCNKCEVCDEYKHGKMVKTNLCSDCRPRWCSQCYKKHVMGRKTICFSCSSNALKSTKPNYIPKKCVSCKQDFVRQDHWQRVAGTNDYRAPSWCTMCNQCYANSISYL